MLTTRYYKRSSLVPLAHKIFLDTINYNPDSHCVTMIFWLIIVLLASGLVEGANTIKSSNSEIANLTIAINKLLTQFSHKCPIPDQSNSRDTINDLMQLVLTKQLLTVDSSSSSCPSPQPNTCNNEGIQQAIEQLNNSIASQAEQISNITNSLVSLTEAVNDLNCCTNEHDPILTSCEAIHKKWPNKPSGYYNISSNGTVHTVYCNMANLCNLEGGWMRIANLNMTQATSCPTEFRLYTNGGVRACGRPVTSSGSCVGKIFSSSGIEYSQVCGKVIGYQVGFTDGAAVRATSIRNNINMYYADGVSLTHGNPREHIWTLMSGAADRHIYTSYCPCGKTGPDAKLPITAPSFVGSNYYCEAGYQGSNYPKIGEFYSSDRLWDGKDCGERETACCQRTLIPWFYKSIGSYTTDDIEMRICCNEGTNDEDVPIEQYDIYVK